MEKKKIFEPFGEGDHEFSDDIRPHPGPFPQERENRLTRFR
jgi:hypothetical protein